jgi:polysaccharide export outer membrane protein
VAVNDQLPKHVSPSSNGDLILGAGDLLELSVFEVEELSKLKVRVPQRGIVRLPLIGPIQATGRTVSEFEDDIVERLKKTYMHEPQVSVFVVEYKSQTITITGAVTKGGVHPLTSPLRVADALALADGLTPEADTTIYLVRRMPAEAVQKTDGLSPASTGATAAPDGTVEMTLPIDLEALSRGDKKLNVLLQAGDVIHVPRANSYYVGGQVAKPGFFPLKTETNVMQAIVAAGSVTNVAAWGDVRLYRVNAKGEREITTLDLDEMEANKQPPPQLRKNDVVVVGKHLGKAFMYGLLEWFRFGLGAGL